MVYYMNYIKKLLYEYELYIVCLFKILILKNEGNKVFEGCSR